MSTGPHLVSHDDRRAHDGLGARLATFVAVTGLPGLAQRDAGNTWRKNANVAGNTWHKSGSAQILAGNTWHKTR